MPFVRTAPQTPTPPPRPDLWAVVRATRAIVVPRRAAMGHDPTHARALDPTPVVTRDQWASIMATPDEALQVAAVEICALDAGVHFPATHFALREWLQAPDGLDRDPEEVWGPLDEALAAIGVTRPSTIGRLDRWLETAPEPAALAAVQSATRATEVWRRIAQTARALPLAQVERLCDRLGDAAVTALCANPHLDAATWAAIGAAALPRVLALSHSQTEPKPWGLLTWHALDRLAIRGFGALGPEDSAVTAPAWAQATAGGHHAQNIVVQGTRGPVPEWEPFVRACMQNPVTAYRTPEWVALIMWHPATTPTLRATLWQWARGRVDGASLQDLGLVNLSAGLSRTSPATPADAGAWGAFWAAFVDEMLALPPEHADTRKWATYNLLGNAAIPVSEVVRLVEATPTAKETRQRLAHGSPHTEADDRLLAFVLQSADVRGLLFGFLQRLRTPRARILTWQRMAALDAESALQVFERGIWPAAEPVSPAILTPLLQAASPSIRQRALCLAAGPRFDETQELPAPLSVRRRQNASRAHRPR